MGKNTVPTLGIAILIVGVLTLFDTFGFFEVGFWFWAAICLIVPCFLGLFRRGRNKIRYLCGLTIGVLLLLYNFDIIGGRMVFPGCIAMLLIIWGVRLIAGDSRTGNNKNARKKESRNDFGNNGGYYYEKHNNGKRSENTTFDSGNENIYYDSGNGRKDENTYYDSGNGRRNENRYYDSANGRRDENTYYDSGNGRRDENTYYDSGNGRRDENRYYDSANGRRDENRYYDSGNGRRDENTYYNSENGWYSDSSGRNSGKSIYDDDYGRASYNRPNDDNEFRQYRINLDGREIVYRNEPFHGIGLKTNLGSVVINLRDAIITKDTNIDVRAVLSGVEILVPRNINVVVIGKPMLGGIDNNTVSPRKGNTFATIYVKAECILSGIDINY